MLRQVSLGPWLDALPHGLHTLVGDVARDVLPATEGRSVVWVTHDAVALDSMDRVVDLAAHAVP